MRVEKQKGRFQMKLVNGAVCNVARPGCESAVLSLNASRHDGDRQG